MGRLSGLGRYAVSRLVVTVPMLLVLLTVVFLVLRVMPGDPAQAILGGRNVPPETAAALRARLGLDEPLPLQYVHYLGSVARGDLGVSARTGNEVWEDILGKIPATLELAVFAMLVAVPIGLWSGIHASTHHDQPRDHALRVLNVASFAIFIPWFGMVLQLVFSVFLKWLPVGGRLEVLHLYTFRGATGLYVLDALLAGNGAVLADALRHLVLPALTLGLLLSGLVGRMSRSSMLEVLDQEYINAARAKGLSERRVVYGHALRNALIPIVTVVGLQFALLMAGAILTEVTFAWPGLARYLLDSITARDFNAIQGSVVFIALFVTTINLLVDLAYGILDPRVRY
ncbi:ABC transporter permease [Limnochorda pilosa]|uniref:Peptide ABC transporter permease n=1 Tax=Limnochorda pilosa TaxID=1555112 RepID=A0A0K2SL46_LIMPI|nr:ABC transporter permease [Limnochorda pilosa]BAS27569.1 peptide ABC transporter permease [Limnochorda pilosa]